MIGSAVCGSLRSSCSSPGAPELGDAPAAVGAVVTLVWGYFAATYPYMLPTSVTISEAAGTSDTLTVVIVVFIAAAVVVVPSLALLYVLSQRQALE
jgi:cytochrome d ubiquinol oxidase subunit II